MRYEVVGRVLRMSRLRRGWTQAEVAARAELSASAVSRIESGGGGRYRLTVLQRHGDALGIRVELQLIGRGGETDRLLDDEHAAIVEHAARILSDAGWLTEPEASFNVFGERGRVDILAFHPATGTLLLVEVKTEITDLQVLFGALGVKQRLGPRLAEARGWPVRSVAVLLAVAGVERNRRVIGAHATLFSAFERNGARVRAWVGRPHAERRSLLLYVNAADASRAAWLATKRRVRPVRRAHHERVGAGSRSPAPVNSPPGHVISAGHGPGSD